MQRNYFRGLIICLIPTLVAGYFAVFVRDPDGNNVEAVHHTWAEQPG